MPEQITLYGHPYSPYFHRVAIVLEATGAKHQCYTVDLVDRSVWGSISPTGKIPFITYGGPEVPPDQPSPESEKIPESLIIATLIAEEHPSAGLIPADPVARARMRLFINEWESSGSAALRAALMGTGPVDAILDVYARLQARLGASTKFAVGDALTLADVAVAPYLPRNEYLMRHEIGKYPLGDGKKFLDRLAGPEFARFREYAEAVKAHPSVEKTYDEAVYADMMGSNPYFKRD
ncbi:thioredoxin-like protein [Epithele typhae]|uniref:thioredoxin-like protein n=1 Tax=Epithele typhae TaxID=378194 RepID=UPI002007EF59|nr:thioredoxin-like protein [Epithele typhae]KAH9935207.1 thioredoxin-like protein [Epithele typhae]